MKKNIFLFLAFALCFAGLNAQTVVTMTNVTDISGTKATFNGNAQSVASGSTINKRGFCIATNSDFTANKKLFSATGTTTGTYSFSITTVANYLTPSTNYYVKAFLRIKTGTVYDTVWSSAMQFSTTALVTPGMTADSASNITINSASIHGTMTSMGDYASVTTKGFIYSQNPNPTFSNGTAVTVSGTVSATTMPKSFSTALSNLNSGRTYYYRLFSIGKISNTQSDTSYSSQKTFITPESCDSIPYNLAKDSVTITEAYLHWTPRVGQANFEIDYGYAGHTPGEGTSLIVNLDTVAHLTGLQGGRSYSAYVRAVCANSYSDWSTLLSFTTMPSPCAEVSGIHTSDIRHSSAIIEWTPGNITQNKWEVLFAKQSDAYPTTPTIVVNDPIFSPIGLTQLTNYKMKIRANCDPFYSEWSEDFTFATIQMGLEDEAQEKLSVKVYPNPSEGVIFFDTQMAQVEKIEIISSLGAQVYSSNKVPEKLNLSRFGAGMYFIQITTDRGIQLEKILIK